MKINFNKYQGAGNDFVILRNKPASGLNNSIINKICDRHFGIGADGLIVVEEKTGYDYEMIYFNSDGNIGSMCGNGARCAFRFAIDQKIVKNEEATFKAFDGLHKARLLKDDRIEVSMENVTQWSFIDESLKIDTGSPHFVKKVSSLYSLNMKVEGSRIRYGSAFRNEGINVNFAELLNDEICMRTYERGVEDETLACGTGTVAVALFHRFQNGKPQPGSFDIKIKAIGGELKVTGEFTDGIFKNIFLIGPAQKVFEGIIEL